MNLDRDEMRTYPVEGGPPVLASGSAVHGPSSRPVLIDPADQRRVVWVAFRVGGAYPFVPADAADLRDAMVDLADLWGHDGAAAARAAAGGGADTGGPARPAGGGPGGRARGVRSNRRARWSRPPRPCTAARRSPPRRTGSAGRRSGSAGRSPSRIGLSPKRFARVRRFQRLVRVASVDPAPDWARLAAEHGYHDQAHLIHEFRAHAARTPGAYRPRSPAEPNHVPV